VVSAEALGSAQLGEPGQPLVLTNGIALVGSELEHREFGMLRIVAGQIESFGPRGGATRTHSDDLILDLEGAFVVPGLIDSHVHFDLAGHPAAYEHYDASVLLRSLTCFHNGLAALRNGITSVRDLGSADHTVLDYASLVRRDLLIGPRVIAAGRPITVSDGHFSQYARVANGPSDVRDAVREQIAAGARVIKLMATGGISTSGNPESIQLTPEELAAAVTEAHQAGLQVAAHAHTHAGVVAALSAGVDSIEHAAFGDDATFEVMASHHATLVPTVSALNNVLPGRGIPAETVRKSLEAREPYLQSVRKAVSAGVHIAAGTDAGTALNPIGGLVDELAMYCDAGMTALQALATATTGASGLIGGRAGIIEPGRPADLMVVAGDPSADVTALRRPLHVVRRGRVIDLAWADRTMSELSRALVG
jgi:imidazolonepropionase-like amidohydrolase